MPAAQSVVIDALQTSVRLHLQAVEHYQTLSEHLGRWGYEKLAHKYAEDVTEERDHLKKCFARLEYYDVQPTYEHSAPEWPRHDFEGILSANMALETASAQAERANILAARSVGDELSALIFADLLEGSEGSIRDIEATQKVIEQIGLDNYLSVQV
jgi:bacterioferritin (cytochrome b1)